MSFLRRDQKEEEKKKCIHIPLSFLPQPDMSPFISTAVPRVDIRTRLMRTKRAREGKKQAH